MCVPSLFRVTLHIHAGAMLTGVWLIFLWSLYLSNILGKGLLSHSWYSASSHHPIVLTHHPRVLSAYALQRRVGQARKKSGLRSCLQRLSLQFILPTSQICCVKRCPCHSELSLGLFKSHLLSPLTMIPWRKVTLSATPFSPFWPRPQGTLV